MVFLKKQKKSKALLKSLKKEMKKKKKRRKYMKMEEVSSSSFERSEVNGSHSQSDTEPKIDDEDDEGCFEGVRCDKLLENMRKKKLKREKIKKLKLLDRIPLVDLEDDEADEGNKDNEHEQGPILNSNHLNSSNNDIKVSAGEHEQRKLKKKKQKLKGKASQQANGESMPLISDNEQDNVPPKKKNGVMVLDTVPSLPGFSKGSNTKPNANGALFSPTVNLPPDIPNLPITECRETFIKNFLENDTLIVVGETGSGKSTQIPKFLIQDCANFFSYRGMAITQPRRVAAISLANRVSYELGTIVGELVGYKVRFEKETSDETKITFLTDGFLMMDAIRDNLFREYSVIIVDEAHERSVETDVVLSLLRNAQIARRKLNPKKKLKLIVMSATLDIDKFKSFYDMSAHDLKTKAVYIKGRPYNLEINYLPKEVTSLESHVDLAWITLLKLHMELPIDHHILIFLTGKEEIDLLVARAVSINQQKHLPPVYVCPLYAALPQEVQLKSFDLPSPETRKIVVSTNIAETSLTIPGIRVVIDSGRVKSKYFEQSLGMDVLRVQMVSKSQSDQRAGRAGREFEGSVYRLYAKETYGKLEQFPLPEITRSNLSRIILLAAVSLGIENFNNFPLPDKPSLKAIQYAMSELCLFGAIETAQLPIRLTRTARRLLSFPVELHLARVLYLAVQYQELSRICAIVAILTVESIYVNQTSPNDIEEGYHRNSQKFKYQTLWAPEGDFLTFWRIFKDFKKSKNKKAWCKEYGIQFRTMVYVTRVWRHLLTLCQNMELENEEKLSCGDAVQFTEKCNLIFRTGFFHQKAKLSGNGKFYIVENMFDQSLKFHAKIHPSSSLIQRKPGRLIFTHLSFNEADNAVYMHNCGVLC